MKYKVGEKVKHKIYGKGIIKHIDSGLYGVEFENANSLLHDCNGHCKEYCGYWCSEGDIIKVRTTKTTSSEEQETILENILKDFNKAQEERNNQFNTILETNLKAFTKEIKQRTIYDEMVQDKVLEKAKELSLKDIEEELHKDMNKYIKDTFGILPKKIEIKDDIKIKEIDGIFHKKFEKIVEEMNKNDEEGLKEAKEEGIRMINNSKKSIVLATENGIIFAGTGLHITATIASMIHSLINKGEIPEEKIVEACLRGITDKEKVGETNLERVNIVLETLKEITK